MMRSFDLKNNRSSICQNWNISKAQLTEKFTVLNIFIRLCGKNLKTIQLIQLEKISQSKSEKKV